MTRTRLGVPPHLPGHVALKASRADTKTQGLSPFSFLRAPLSRYRFSFSLRHQAQPDRSSRPSVSLRCHVISEPLIYQGEEFSLATRP